MELTHEMANEAIARAGEKIRTGQKIEAIKAIRSTFNLGLREAMGFIEAYANDLPMMLKRLKEHAGLAEADETPVRIFETAHFRLTLKRPTELTLERLERFFDETLFDLKKDLKG